MEQEVIVAGKQVLARHSRTFRLASLWLDSQTRGEVAVLYAMCRLIDDLADETRDIEWARHQLHRLREELEGTAQARPLVAQLKVIAERRELDLAIVDELIEGVVGDLGEVRVESEVELLRYCYRVAGTVGLMMCAVLGVDDERGLAHAIDLGVAMQLTNICRDVREDGRRGRIYLPLQRLEAAGISAQQIIDESVDRQALAGVVEEVLELAERYYASGDRGMRYIPARSRFAILVASRNYRAIGRRLRRRKCDVMAGRTVVSSPMKMMWLMASVWSWIGMGLQASNVGGDHEASLHAALVGFPGVNEERGQ